MIQVLKRKKAIEFPIICQSLYMNRLVDDLLELYLVEDAGSHILSGYGDMNSDIKVGAWQQRLIVNSGSVSHETTLQVLVTSKRLARRVALCRP